LYSLSFAPNPKFLRLFPDQAEILSYLENVAGDFDVLPHIRYNASWESARWQDDTKTWLLKLRMGKAGMVIEHECKVLISAVGRLVNPNPFEILGQDKFEGQIVHSAQWRCDIVLKDKEVVVIGNGCKFVLLSI
jgi:cation diffusion facilitator CzcD-associated flavoprotein CzcO